MAFPDAAAREDPAYDWTAPGFHLDPYPVLHRMRAQSPVHFDRRLESWVLTSYRDVLEALRSPVMGQVEQQKRIDSLPASDQEALLPLRRTFRLWAGQGDDEDHARFASIARPAMGARKLEPLRPRIQRIMDELLDPAVARGGFDAVHELARPFAMRTITEFLGISTLDLERLQGCVDRIAGLFALGTREQLYASQEGMVELGELLAPAVAQRRAAPTDDLLGAFADPRAALPDEFVVAQAILLIAAGFYPTANLLANGLHVLLEHPAEQEVLRRDPSLIANAVEEMARFGGPPFSTRKVARTEVSFGNRTVKPGESVVLAIGAGNRDPEVFSSPDRFDVKRRGLNRSLAFGTTTYHCVGRPLVRIEGKVFFGTLLRRLPNLATLDWEPSWAPLPPFGRELRRLRITVGEKEGGVPSTSRSRSRSTSLPGGPRAG